MTAADAVTEADRYPLLTPAGREMLMFLREHPCAPIFRNESGHRLTLADVETVRAREREVLDGEVGWAVDAPPGWVAEHVAYCYAQVPHWRALGEAPARFSDVPPSARADLSRDIARFVPDDAPLDRLINFRTSGTTGHPLLIASHPVVAASYLAYHKRALRRFGIELRHGRGQVGVVLIGLQRSCFTYVSVTPTMDESGLAKINLHPGDWRRVDDRAPYLDALAAEVWTGDPISFAELLRLPLTCRPRAMLSTSMALLPGLRDALQARFGCPVLDIYSLNEAGPVAVDDPQLGGHALLQPRLYVEILDPAGKPVPPGERGEVTLTGGFNFCLPLLRYRTGDYAAMRWRGREPWLEGLSGRPPVRFLSSAGEWLNNIEVTHALKPLALAQWSLHQAADRSLTLRADGSALTSAEAALRALFGGGLPLRVEPLPPHVDKLVQYTSDLVGAAPGSTA
jgi:phenylacetate-CoA ligase